MNDDVNDIIDHYNRDPQLEHSRLDRHQLEHDLTWRYLDQYLPPAGSILEIGAATGRYTVGLAQRGYRLTAVDISSALLGECANQVAEAGLGHLVQVVEADARDLSPVGADEFDAALLMGPLYHLIEEADRATAVRQAYERLRPGGILISAFISRFGILGNVMKKIPEWIEDQEQVRALIERGKRPEGRPRGGFRGYFAEVSEIAPLHEKVGFETMVIAGVEPAISADDESYNRLDGRQRQLWCDLLFEIGTEASTLGASRHLLFIGKKR